MAAPRVFTIAASTPFIPTLIRALLDGELVSGFLALREVDEDEIAFAQAAPGALAADALQLPDALGAFERRMLLAQLVLKWAASIAPDKKGEAPLVASNP